MSRKDNDHSDRFSTTMGDLGRKTADFEEGGVVG